MRFPTAWANIAKQNVILRIAVLSQSALVLFLGIVVIKIALRSPLLIERACYSRALSYASNKHTKEEIEAFIREALPMRFDSKTIVKAEYLASSESQLREKEQAEISNRQMSQRLVINVVDINENVVSVEADRLISFGKIRSAFSFPLKLTLSNISRSDSNPYGLVLVKSAPVQDPEKR